MLHLTQEKKTTPSHAYTLADSYLAFFEDRGNPFFLTFVFLKMFKFDDFSHSGFLPISIIKLTDYSKYEKCKCVLNKPGLFVFRFNYTFSGIIF